MPPARALAAQARAFRPHVQYVRSSRCTWHRPQAPRPEDTGHGNARRAVGALGILGFPRSSCDRGGISCHEAGPQKSAGRFTFRNGLVFRSIDLRKVTSVARA